MKYIATALTLYGVMELMTLSPSLSLSSLCMLALTRSNEPRILRARSRCALGLIALTRSLALRARAALRAAGGICEF